MNYSYKKKLKSKSEKKNNLKSKSLKYAWTCNPISPCDGPGTHAFISTCQNSIYIPPAGYDPGYYPWVWDGWQNVTFFGNGNVYKSDKAEGLTGYRIITNNTNPGRQIPNYETPDMPPIVKVLGINKCMITYLEDYKIRITSIRVVFTEAQLFYAENPDLEESIKIDVCVSLYYSQADDLTKPWIELGPTIVIPTTWAEPQYFSYGLAFEATNQYDTVLTNPWIVMVAYSKTPTLDCSGYIDACISYDIIS